MLRGSHISLHFIFSHILLFIFRHQHKVQGVCPAHSGVRCLRTVWCPCSAGGYHLHLSNNHLHHKMLGKGDKGLSQFHLNLYMMEDLIKITDTRFCNDVNAESHICYRYIGHGFLYFSYSLLLCCSIFMVPDFCSTCFLFFPPFLY